jgi:hypothetical protein
MLAWCPDLLSDLLRNAEVLADVSASVSDTKSRLGGSLALPSIGLRFAPFALATFP